MQEDPLVTQDGTSLYGEAHLVGNAKAHIVMVHGYAEHCGRYRHVAKLLNSWGMSVYAHDHRAHGRSPGLQAYITNMDFLVNDLAEQIKRVKGRAGHQPVFVIAHSMGTGITIKAALTHSLPVAGYVFSGSIVKIPDNISPLLQKLAPLIAKIAPKIAVGDAGGAKFLSTDPAVAHSFESDPLCYNGKVRAKTGHEILKLSRWVHRHLNKFTAPLLLLHGTEDRLAEFSGSQLFVEKASSQDKILIPFEGLMHEVFNELRKEDVFREIDRWINRQLSKLDTD